MANVLYITAHPLTAAQSISMATGETFLKEYQTHHPEDTVQHVDLFKAEVPYIDSDVFSGWGKLGEGIAFNELTEAEQAKVGRLSELHEQFMQADKYVFVTPLWNLGFPPVVKAYLDAVAVPGKTFRYSEEGPVGLLTDKKAVHIQARGGNYSEGPAADLEMGDRYIRQMMTFFGVPSYDALFVEGHNAQPEQAEEIKLRASQEARELAVSF
ncbi:FMN-dependent NADH-azoreductase [Salisediminibacterium beveridgei]|uniref:FMN dependent NADH:quinone oxidoreductase n=1 Tax=Salisediminibacterium beveridgei TaxID=632773 RepID=A0A1D7QXU5_9BACI|nr:FMN-dependent NADH-azoreductase [Salisediminibacterium beveridgei]AOM83824.1 FMN-dependent NADH-azoreductase [Salisediminibacterium beveridgei]